VDGEGTGDGVAHRYVLLGCGDSYISAPEGLSFPQIMQFLWDRYLEKPSSVYVGFFLGYDFTQWLKLLPEDRARILFHPELRARKRSGANLTPFPVQYAGWEFDILGMKRFKLRKTGASSWMYICDTGSFFQASLMTVIDPVKWSVPVVSESEYVTLKEGKERRDHAALDDSMVAYNALENQGLSRLMGRVATGLSDAGVCLRRNQWFGPGQAAQAWLTLNKMITSKEITSDADSGFNEASRQCYFGGWFEITAHGKIPGLSYEYDINSAYPYIASRLPCLRHGKWDKGTGVPRGLRSGTLCAVYGKAHGSGVRLGSMLHRVHDGSILRPYNTEGWFWYDELEASRAAGLVDNFEWGEWVSYEPCDCDCPLDALNGLYDRRLAVGKDSPEGKGLKLIYNSVYGKFAQSVGQPKYGNPVYASRITSGCRRMILEAIASHPEGEKAVLMIATDGIVFRSPHPGLTISERMGDWSASVRKNLSLFKPGVYWDDETRRRISRGETAAFKSRGISAREFSIHIADVDAQFARWIHGNNPAQSDSGPGFPRITFSTRFSMVTPKQALDRGKWHLAGTLGHEPIDGGCQGCSGAHLTQDSNPAVKRDTGSLEMAPGGIWYSRPWESGGGNGVSVAYSKMFGMEDPEVYGVTDDGYVMDSWIGMIR
jgi:hypothetical protein